jgi:hypothetical protein
MALRAFIVRPFGVKNDIDFDQIERELIDPALTAVGIEGRTTGEIVKQGNIQDRHVPAPADSGSCDRRPVDPQCQCFL